MMKPCRNCGAELIIRQTKRSPEQLKSNIITLLIISVQSAEECILATRIK